MEYYHDKKEYATDSYNSMDESYMCFAKQKTTNIVWFRSCYIVEKAKLQGWKTD
jgi:hypothetical protein